MLSSSIFTVFTLWFPSSCPSSSSCMFSCSLLRSLFLLASHHCLLFISRLPFRWLHLGCYVHFIGFWVVVSDSLTLFSLTLFSQRFFCFVFVRYSFYIIMLICRFEFSFRSFQRHVLPFMCYVSRSCSVVDWTLSLSLPVASPIHVLLPFVASIVHACCLFIIPFHIVFFHASIVKQRFFLHAFYNFNVYVRCFMSSLHVGVLC